jgi:hypothetical protein
MSTRKLIIAALLCGMAIVLAFTIQLVTAVNNRQSGPVPAPGATTVAR